MDEDEIPTGSMGDIAFLLIIFFILTTVFAKDKGIKMELPSTETQETLTLKAITISVEKDGTVSVDGEKTAVSEISTYILGIKSRNPEKFVMIKSDKNARYGVIMDVMDELMAAGIKDIALPTEEEEKK